MAPNEQAMLDVAAAILDGTPVDWRSAESNASKEDRQVLEALRLLCSVADLHRDAPAEPDTGPDAGQQYWGRLRLIERVGGGTFGDVYRAWDTRLQREVALKLISIGDDPRDHRSSAILSEARLLARVRHPGVVTLYDAERIETRVGLCMEFVEGPTLQQRIDEDGPFDANEAIHVGLHLCDALTAVHDAGILHRDIKASNVSCRTDGSVVLMDFGAGRRVDDLTAESSGTPLYLAPEVLAAQPATVRSDIYSLGVLLYNMLTGSYPVTAQSLNELRLAHEQRSSRRQRIVVPPGIPASLAAIIERAIDPRPERRHPTSAALGSELRALQGGRRLRATTVLAAVIAGGVALGTGLVSTKWNFFDRRIDSGTPGAAPVAVAVLPLANPDRDPDIDYLASGIAESVISSLAQVPGKLHVLSRIAVQPYRNRELDAMAVGRELNVSAVLLGSIVQRGDVVVVDVELVSTADRRRLWGATYEKNERELVEVEHDIATRIATALQLRLTGGEQRSLKKQYPSNPAAYPLYLQGRDHWYRSTPADYERSLRYFQQAIQLDDTYGLAHAGVARALSTMAFEGLLSPSAFREAGKAASTALSLDDTVGAAHEALAHYKFGYEWNWKEAEDEYKRAIALSPDDEAGHRYYGMFLRAQRRWDEAVASMKNAVAVNPRSAETIKALGATYFWARQYDLAIEQYLKALEIDPTHAQVHDLLADAYAAKGMYARALDARRAYLRLGGAFDAADAIGTDASERGYLHAMRALHTQYLAALERDAATKYVSPLEFALVYIALDERDRAFPMLDKAYGERVPWLSSIGADPAFDRVRSDPRFQTLLQRIGLAHGSP